MVEKICWAGTNDFWFEGQKLNLTRLLQESVLLSLSLPLTYPWDRLAWSYPLQTAQPTHTNLIVQIFSIEPHQLKFSVHCWCWEGLNVYLYELHRRGSVSVCSFLCPSGSCICQNPLFYKLLKIKSPLLPIILPAALTQQIWSPTWELRSDAFVKRWGYSCLKSSTVMFCQILWAAAWHNMWKYNRQGLMGERASSQVLW